MFLINIKSYKLLISSYIICKNIINLKTKLVKLFEKVSLIYILVIFSFIITKQSSIIIKLNKSIK